MRAVRTHQGSAPYSAANPAPPSSLFLDDNVPIPQLARPGELLIRVHAATVTRDELAWPETYGPNHSILGHDFAGEVVDTFDHKNSSPPDDQTALAPGDHVYGMTAASREYSTWAQFAVVKSDETARKPASLDWAAAATVPMSALTAWQALFVHARVPEPDLSTSTTNTAPTPSPRKLLVTGASGAVGSYLVQLGALAGLDVTAASRSKTANAEFLHSLGAAQIAEYDELLGKESEYDIITDTVGGEALENCWYLVKDGGHLITVDSSSLDFVEKHQKRLDGKAKRENVNALGFIVEKDHVQLQKIAMAVDLGLLKAFVAQVFPIHNVCEAYETGSMKSARRGKIVLLVDV
ncbi:putative alcohol dehydrogenase [Aspergillus ambiguus]|uniref:NADP-dependent oxidoreductase n=1 Tax=Aspergillus ambiguus TaxID=176160 RepID=UPI003CCE3B9A